jgi:geranylgeranyl pyrophosphate synthase
MSSIKEIVDMQVPSLVKNSLLIGYYCGGGSNQIIEEALMEIGDISGFFFQLLNDMEPYLNIENNINHKSVANYDFLDNRKSTVIAYLGEFLSNAEKQKYSLIKSDEKKKEFIFKKLKKYKVMQFLFDQIDLMRESMHDHWHEMLKADIDPLWHKYFWDFLNVLISTGQERLGKQIF